MNAIAISVGSITVYWSSLIIALGVLAGLVMGLSLCRDDKCRASAVLCFYPPAILFSVFFSRLIHWYSYMEQYASFVAAVTDYSAGGYCVSGVVLGVLLAGAVVRWAGLVGRIGSLFDTVLPGVVLSVAILRLSESFGNICRSKISVTAPLLQRLPFAVASTDSAGNVSYKFATFFVSFLLLALLSLVLVRLCVHRRDVPMLRGMSRTGNVARLGLVLFATIEIVLDSTRSDPVLSASSACSCTISRASSGTGQAAPPRCSRDISFRSSASVRRSIWYSASPACSCSTAASRRSPPRSWCLSSAAAMRSAAMNRGTANEHSVIYYVY